MEDRFFAPETNMRSMTDLYNDYKYHHFFSICFGLGCGLASYRPYYSADLVFVAIAIAMPVILATFFTVVFEFVGVSLDLPAHTKECKGRPYHWKDTVWGLGFALMVALVHLRSYHVYTLSYGLGIVVFALRGAKRKYSSLWKIRGY